MVTVMVREKYADGEEVLAETDIEFTAAVPVTVKDDDCPFEYPEAEAMKLQVPAYLHPTLQLNVQDPLLVEHVVVPVKVLAGERLSVIVTPVLLSDPPPDAYKITSKQEY